MTTGNDQPGRGYHDLGGMPGEPLDQSEHVLEPWEKRVDAMRMLLGDDKRNILRSDGLRNAIESMGEDIYKELGYYERWMAAITRVLSERNVVSRAELEAKMAEIRERDGLGDIPARPMPAPPEGA